MFMNGTTLLITSTDYSRLEVFHNGEVRTVESCSPDLLKREDSVRSRVHELAINCSVSTSLRRFNQLFPRNSFLAISSWPRHRLLLEEKSILNEPNVREHYYVVIWVFTALTRYPGFLCVQNNFKYTQFMYSFHPYLISERFYIPAGIQNICIQKKQAQVD